MLALLVAAAVTVAQPEAKPLVLADSAQVHRIYSKPACKGAARLQTSYQPTLLFREQDRANARAKRLTELPMAEACLVAERGTGR